MNIFSRILQFIEFKGISKNKFSKEIGLSNSYMTKMEGSNNVGSKIIENIVRIYPELNLNWLIKGEGNMLLTDESNNTNNNDMNCNNCPYKEMVDRYQAMVDRLTHENERISTELRTLRHQDHSSGKRHSA